MSDEGSFRDLLRGSVNDGLVDDLARFGELLEIWGARHNLVGASSRKELVVRHLLESLAPVKEMGDRGCLLDIGSGAGLPGVPLLCAKRQWSGVLLEPRMKRWAFLKTVVRELKLDAEVRRERYQDLSEGVFDLMTSRAVGGHKEILMWAEERLSVGGRVALWATEAEEDRLQKCGRWHMLSSPIVGLDRGRLLLIQMSST